MKTVDAMPVYYGEKGNICGMKFGKRLQGCVANSDIFYS